MGYTQKELESFISLAERMSFFHWINGQTGTFNEKGESIYYTGDVKRFLNRRFYYLEK